ncbi:hypothetical protein OE88DRAFT_1649449 [Heliocybe sulcata]|uniref:Uncharacterized protein n=1 Tax=Heliocybe sulcata TaxID=5364 RepID=A0A5C3MMP2_9AGAM|nr:hypothetical protein OE88DRAFT_1649449 [Heliocybe sulcata]
MEGTATPQVRRADHHRGHTNIRWGAKEFKDHSRVGPIGRLPRHTFSRGSLETKTPSIPSPLIGPNLFWPQKMHFATFLCPTWELCAILGDGELWTLYANWAILGRQRFQSTSARPHQCWQPLPIQRRHQRLGRCHHHGRPTFSRNDGPLLELRRAAFDSGLGITGEQRHSYGSFKIACAASLCFGGRSGVAGWDWTMGLIEGERRPDAAYGLAIGEVTQTDDKTIGQRSSSL